jgi:hypothetical protein
MLSETDTQFLRESPDSAPESCVYTNGSLMAVVYCEPDSGQWHMYLADKKHDIDINTVTAARLALLPNIAKWGVQPIHLAENFSMMHVYEIEDLSGGVNGTDS